jgi:hypothetical protein
MVYMTPEDVEELENATKQYRDIMGKYKIELMKLVDAGVLPRKELLAVNVLIKKIDEMETLIGGSI